MADPDAFLARWSRLKRHAQSGAQPQDAAPAPPVAAAETRPAQSPKPEPELPPIESLGKDSDYTGFMRADVPDALRNQALRKLWQSDPVFANLDGLVEYGEDFGAAFKLGGAVATVYRVLEGMPGPAEEKAAEPAEGTAETVLPAGEPRERVAAADSTPPREDGAVREENIGSDQDVGLD